MNTKSIQVGNVTVELASKELCDSLAQEGTFLFFLPKKRSRPQAAEETPQEGDKEAQD